MANKFHDAMLADKTQSLVWLLNDVTRRMPGCDLRAIDQHKGHVKKNAVQLNYDKERHVVGRMHDDETCNPYWE
eukprot:12906095-Prorocentrum_lima.AAC.1